MKKINEDEIELEKEKERQARDLETKKFNEEWHWRTNRLRNKSFEDKCEDYTVAKNICKCLSIEWSDKWEHYIHELQKTYFTKNPKSVYYTQNWLDDYRKKHQVTMTIWQEALLTLIYTSIGEHNKTQKTAI